MSYTMVQLQQRLRNLADDIQMSGLYGHARRARSIATQLGHVTKKGRKAKAERTLRELMADNEAYFRKHGHW